MKMWFCVWWLYIQPIVSDIVFYLLAQLPFVHLPGDRSIKMSVGHHQLLVILFRSLAPPQTGTTIHLQETVEFFCTSGTGDELLNEF